MEEDQKTHITKNISRLVNSTTNEYYWYTHLLKHGFISQGVWETIKSNTNTASRIREMYFHCMNTPNYKLFIQTLKDCDNNIAAKVLEEFYATSTSSISLNNSIFFIWFDIKSPTKFFKGRERETKGMSYALKQSMEDKSLSFVTITGLGGVGKTELAKNFLAHVYHEIQTHCIWVNADNPQTISDSFQRLANEIGIPLIDEKMEKAKTLETLSSEVYKILCREMCIFVFDNVEKNEEIAVLKTLVEYSNVLPPSELRPFCLLISRQKLTHQHGGYSYSVKHMNLNVLSEDAAISFLKAKLKIDEAIEEKEMMFNLKLICQKLSCFPLALQLAVACIKAMKRNGLPNEMQIYMNAFEKQTKKLVDYPIPQLESLDEISRTMYPILQITLNQINILPRIGSKAENILNIISFLHAENIDIKFISKIVEKQQPGKVKNTTLDIFELLENYSICRISNIGDRTVVSIHRLFQKLTHIRLNEKKSLLYVLDKVLKILFDMLKDEEVPLSEMIHVENLWRHSTNRNVLVKSHKDLPEQIFLNYCRLGRYTEADDFLNKSIKDLELVLGKDDRANLRLGCRKALILEEFKEYESALGILNDVYEKQKRLFTEQDNDTLTTVKQLGALHFKLRNLNDAMNWWNHALEITEKICPAEDFEPLDLKKNVALVLCEQEKYEDALKILEDVLSVREKLWGAYHPNTISTKYYIGHILYCQGKYEEALYIYEEVLFSEVVTMGKDHPSTLVTRNSVGNVKYCLGRYEEAKQIWEEVLSLEETLLGNDDTTTITTKTNIDKCVKGIEGKLKENPLLKNHQHDENDNLVETGKNNEAKKCVRKKDKRCVVQ